MDWAYWYSPAYDRWRVYSPHTGFHVHLRDEQACIDFINAEMRAYGTPRKPPGSQGKQSSETDTFNIAV